MNKAVVIYGPDDLSRHGKGVRLSFTMKITPRMTNKRLFENEEFVSYTNPIESYLSKNYMVYVIYC